VAHLNSTQYWLEETSEQEIADDLNRPPRPLGTHMSTSSVWSFTDPDEFTARVRATSMELATTRSGRFAAKMIRIDLNRMWLQRFSDSLPRVAHFNHCPGRAIISFRTHAGPELV
jgi:hypothetical protein